MEEGQISTEEDLQTRDSLEKIDKEMQKRILDLHDRMEENGLQGP